MARHVREGQGVCSIQVTCSSWNERSRKSSELYTQMDITKGWIKNPKCSTSVPRCMKWFDLN